MPYKRADSLIWYASYTDASGKRVRRSTETTERREAEALEAKWKLEARQQRLWGIQPSRTFDELMIAYLKATQDTKRSASRDLSSIKRLKVYFSGRELGNLKRADVRGYIEHRKAHGVTGATINREVGLLSGSINYARKEWDWEIPNPAERMRLNEGEGRKRFASVAEVTALINAAEGNRHAPYLADLIRLAINTGCRRGELLGLRWSQVDLNAGTLKLEGKDTKSGKARIVPLNQDARRALQSRARYRAENCPDSLRVFCRRSGAGVASVKTSWTKVLRKAGLEDFHFHDLRHTCGSWLVQSGVPLAAVKEVLGHSTIRMTERYAHHAPENIRAAVEKLSALSQTGHTGSSEHLENIGSS